MKKMEYEEKGIALLEGRSAIEKIYLDNNCSYLISLI
jgi:hypothetical protein